MLSFSVADKLFDVPAANVLEVRKTPVLTRVPNSSASLAGLMNYHGSAIAVVRMSALMNLTTKIVGAARETRVVVYHQDPPVGLLVDQVIELSSTESGRRKAKSVDVEDLLTTQFVVGKSTKTSLRDLGDGGIRQPAQTQASVSLLAFRVSGQRYALPLDAVSEVISLAQDVAELPRSADDAIGMLRYRETVLPLVSVAALLGLDVLDGRQHVLICRMGEHLIGLVVGLVDGVVRIAETAVEPVPVILQRGHGDAEIDGIARLDDERSLLSILSPAMLFRNREIEKAVAQSTTGGAAMSEQAADAVFVQFVVFRLGEEPYGLPIDAVEEIVRLPESLTRVPGAPPFVVGVMNLRGKPLPLIDQRRRFGSSEKEQNGRVVVTTVGDLQAGFIVDSVSEILRVAADQIVPAPDMPGDGVRVFDRVAPSAGEMVLIVDPKELLDQAERDMLARFKTTEERAETP